jgi:thiol-disulfide isomerase/thioredoxin
MILPCLGGGANVDLAALRGPLVLNFWSQTCGPCQEESPLLQRFATAAAGRVSVMGVDFYDPLPGRAIDFAKELDITYPQLADPNAATRSVLHVSGLPMTLLVDRAGRIAYSQFGAFTSEHQVEQLVEEHLGVRVPVGAGS